jgi:hypothetical protein
MSLNYKFYYFMLTKIEIYTTSMSILQMIIIGKEYVCLPALKKKQDFKVHVSQPEETKPLILLTNFDCYAK